MPDGFEPRKVRPSHRRFYYWGCGGDEAEYMGSLGNAAEYVEALGRGPTRVWEGIISTPSSAPGDVRRERRRRGDVR